MERQWTCTRCGLAVKGNEDKFRPDVGRVGGVSSHCRKCHNKRQVERRTEKKAAGQPASIPEKATEDLTFFNRMEKWNDFGTLKPKDIRPYTESSQSNLSDAPVKSGSTWSRKWECTRCGLVIKGNEDKFPPDIGRVGLVSSWCRDCHNKYRKVKRDAEKAKLLTGGLMERMRQDAKKIRTRAYYHFYTTGVTPEDLRDRWTAIGGKCCKCGVERVNWYPIVPFEFCEELEISNLQLLCRKCKIGQGCFGIDFTVSPPVIQHNPIGAVFPDKKEKT